MNVLLVLEESDGKIKRASWEALAAAQRLGPAESITAVVIGAQTEALAAEAATKPVGKGTGLGLSVCCEIVRKRGGDLEIENVKPNGARVTIKFLIAEAPAPPLFAAVARA